ncbi:MAG: ABC transporter permease, partial [Planctomycetota bacterium]
MLPFSYALRNLWRHRARTIATLLGVGFVTLLVTTMASFAASLDGVSSSSTEEDRVYLLGT